MYCKSCGSQLDDEAVVCPYCGVATGVNQPAQTHSNETNTLAIVGFVLSFFTALIGLIISAIALHKAKTEYNGNGKGFAIAGIVIGAVEMGAIFLYVIIIVAGLAVLGAAATTNVFLL